MKENDDEKTRKERFALHNKSWQLLKATVPSQCPKCGMSISPEDETEDNYKILDTKVVNDELSELVISCGKCGSTIKITGFELIGHS